MNNYKRFYGIILFTAVVAGLIYFTTMLIQPPIAELQKLKTQNEKAKKDLKDAQNRLDIVQTKLKKIKDSISGSQKKIYAPLESDLGNDTLFFNLYSDLIEMVHSNSVKIKSISHTPNPDSDAFVNFGKDAYFVTDIDMELVSNYTNLGKLLQEIYQYRYYIKINHLEVTPFHKDKKILLSKLSLRMYAKTEPEEETNTSN